jgi:hypothetical protein
MVHIFLSNRGRSETNYSSVDVYQSKIVETEEGEAVSVEG